MTKRTATAIRFPPELHAQLAAAAAERQVSMNFLVNRAVADFIPRLIPVDELEWTVAPSGTAPTEESTT
jgi:predicted transcriptional regulator